MRFTIITINYNNKDGLQQTLDSVLKQRFTDFEHVIVDGGSSDGSVDIIKAYSPAMGKWISEKDAGVYDAMNKGIRMAIGEYLVFMNSGDTFASADALQLLASNLDGNDIVFGDLIDVSRKPPQRFSYAANPTFDYMLSAGLPHQATAVRRKLFEKVGLYESNYKVIADWAFFMLALFRHNASAHYVPEVICAFEGGGISSQSSNLPMIIAEHHHFLKQHFPESIQQFNALNVMVKKFLRSKPRWKRWYYEISLKTA